MSTELDAANALLMGGGARSAKFETMNVPVIGTIVDTPKVQQMKKFQSEELDFWPSGDPKMQIVVTIQTDAREDQDDDGRRVLFITPRMQHPLRDAVAKSGAKGIAIGGRIAFVWVSGSGQGKGNAKEFAAEYQAPQVDVGALLSQPSTPAPPASMLAPANADQSRAVAAAPQPAPPGIDPAKWASLTAEQQAAVIAAMPPF